MPLSFFHCGHCPLPSVVAWLVVMCLLWLLDARITSIIYVYISSVNREVSAQYCVSVCRRLISGLIGCCCRRAVCGAVHNSWPQKVAKTGTQLHCRGLATST